MGPLISIITTSYNYERYIGRSIESVLQQSYGNWELIIVDDCSPDSSWDVISQYKDPRIRAFRNEVNLGACATYNKAYSYCRGSLIASLDSDDVFLPEMLATQAAEFQCHPEIGVSGTKIEVIDEFGKIVPDSAVAAWFNDSRDLNAPGEWVWENHLCHSSVIIRKEIHDAVGGLRDDLTYTPDWNLWIRALAAGARFSMVDQVLLQYRVHGNNITHKDPLSMISEYAQTTREVLTPYLLQRKAYAAARENFRRFAAHPLLKDRGEDTVANVLSAVRQRGTERSEHVPSPSDVAELIADLLLEEAKLRESCRRLEEREAEREQRLACLEQELAQQSQQAKGVPVSGQGELEQFRRFMSTLRPKLLRLARVAYHRAPLPLHVKWRIRQYASPTLALLRGQRSDVFGVLRDTVAQQSRQEAGGNGRSVSEEDILSRMLGDLSEQVRETGPVGHIIVLPFLGTGGAETTALNFARAVREFNPGESVLIVVADRPTVDKTVQLPQGVHALALDAYYGTGASYAIKGKALQQLALLIRPHTFHNINSEVAWQLIIAEGARLRAAMTVVSSIFALQFAENRKDIIGYAANFFTKGLPQVDLLLTDNHRFIEGASASFGVSEAEQGKIVAVYNPVRIDQSVALPSRHAQAEHLRAAGKSRSLRFLWAGRLDAEKRVDLLYAIARQCPSIHFEVFGQAVLKDTEMEPMPPNVSLHGAFASPAELVAQGPYDGFLFTSRWEGMPNILLEVGALGIPLIAPTVGGVGELVSDQTGYPLKEYPEPADYIEGMHAIANAPEVALAKTQRLCALIDERHGWEAFARSVRALHGYLPEQED
ncbi:glycosyltransferase [Cupriavidus sp. MP-37]|uniref:glycosyltransferase n=1 Tax=Cupriavidus sp. MP-37 TaxID=2884455 RepID=UPI001D0A2968|nr:glycosyltransferase [Cupriavidus sp. MP-37]UDM51226.1 glycosyltransferase [Cupriavidus sp. MP-37]